MYIFNGHTDICENIDEKRSRGINRVISGYHVPEWKKGKITGGFYPTWINPAIDMPRKMQFERILKNLHCDLDECAADAAAVYTAEDYFAALAKGRHALFMGAEGLSFCDEEPDKIFGLYASGLRIASLTWNETNAFACGAGASGADDRGLSDAGRQCVSNMQQAGMLVDLAHTSKKTFWQITEMCSKTPVISHGACSALCPAGRNYSDDQLRQIAQLGGVIGIAAYPPFLSENEKEWNVDSLARHVVHAVEIAGEDHVGFGFDTVDFLDDYKLDPEISFELEGFTGEGDAPALIECLKKLGCNEPLLEKLCHGNFERVIRNTFK